MKSVSWYPFSSFLRHVLTHSWSWPGILELPVSASPVLRESDTQKSSLGSAGSRDRTDWTPNVLFWIFWKNKFFKKKKTKQKTPMWSTVFLQLPNGQSLPLPPIILAELGNDPKKPTVCFYGHLDVQPAQQSDGWLTDPHTLTEVGGQWRLIPWGCDHLQTGLAHRV
jgi:hypothetical protein